MFFPGTVGIYAMLMVSIGKAWTSDYGDPHDPYDFDFIYPISPLHNVQTDRILPPTILLTADRKYPVFKWRHHELNPSSGR